MLGFVLLIQGGNGGLTPTKDEPGAYTKALVEEAIERYESDWLYASIEHWNNPENVDGEWYVFTVNREGYTTARHSPNSGIGSRANAWIRRATSTVMRCWAPRKRDEGLITAS